ncbi:MAG: ABC transporter permease [Ruminiclostridium sp.]|nr:ABC transporter permease [Ruminiclostridium sp.]
MKISDMLKMCLRNLWRRKGRTLLTVTGVVIGSCAVIVMISLGIGMNKALDGMLASMGDLTAINIYNFNYGGASDEEKTPLDDAAVEAMEAIENVTCVIPKLQVDSSMVTIAAGKNDRYKMSWADIYGVDFSLFDKMNYSAEQGEMPTEAMYKDAVVFGNEMAYQFRDTKKKGQNSYTWKQELPDGTFSKPFVEPVGETIMFYINNSKKTDDEGNFLYGGRGYEHKLTGTTILAMDPNWETPYSIFIDIDLAKDIINDYNRLNGVRNTKGIDYTQVKIIVNDLDNVAAVQEEIEAMGFTASSMAQIREEMQGYLGIIQLVLGGLAAISLLVAAISITNTMIMSIYERTKEIGIMKVLGCFIGNIRIVFLMEAGLIGLLGGIMGTLISYGISAVMNMLGSGVFASMMGIAVEDSRISIIPIWLVLLALVFATIIGLISGFYPANRAVKISALEAIRNE